jgi:hypothetical protein
MKKFLISFLFCGVAMTSYGQFITNDPIHTGITTLIKLVQDPSFKKIVTGIEKLKKVSSGVQQYQRGREVITTINTCTQKLSSLSTAVSKDGHIYPAEYTIMIGDLQRLAEAGTGIIKNMKAATTQSGSVLEMTDAERIEWLDKAYKEVKQYESAIDAYFSNIRSASMRRSGSRADVASTSRLYDAAYVTAPIYQGGNTGVIIDNKGYDDIYVNDTTSILDNAFKTKEAEALRKLQEVCQVRIANYYDEKQLREMQFGGEAFNAMLREGYVYKLKNPEFSIKSLLTTNIFSVVQDSEDLVNNVKTLNNSATGTTSEEITSTIKDAVDGFIAPDGKRISNEEFEVLMRIKSRQLFIDNKINEQLMEKYKLAECNRMGY